MSSIDALRSRLYTRYLIALREKERLSIVQNETKLPGDRDVYLSISGMQNAFMLALQDIEQLFPFAGKVKLDETLLMEYEKDISE